VPSNGEVEMSPASGASGDVEEKIVMVAMKEEVKVDEVAE